MTRDEVFEELRPTLTGVSYRILGSWADAEDIVQNTWLKWRNHHEEVRSPRGWLTRVAVRASIDGLRSRQAKREDYPGEWLPEPVSLDPGPEDLASDRHAVSLGILVMMESLSPLERAVFVLRSVFAWDYDEIAEVLDKTPDALRQLDHRARKHLQAQPERFTPDPEQVRSATERFLAACVGGSIESMMDSLAPGVVLHSDGGGEAKAPRRSIVGPDKVARFFAGRSVAEGLGHAAFRSVDVNGLPGLLASVGGQPVAVISIDVDAAGRITDIYLVAAPSKLGSVRP